MSNSVVLEARNLSKNYWQGDGQLISILENVNFKLYKKEIVALLGPSGSGKTTFLNILGMLDNPSKGDLLIQGVNVINYNDNQKTKLRSKNIGFVFQFHHLLPDFTVLENVILPQLINGIKQDKAKKKALEIIENLSIQHRLNHFPSMLSGGEQQRVALARALSVNPNIIIADEPTGNLDKETASDVFNLIQNTVDLYDLAVILATHDTNLAEKTNKKYYLENKKIILS